MVGLNWCGVLSGKVSTAECSVGERDLFYVLDQVPILAFFAVYALLVQFWAEVYYNAVDKIPMLTSFVKPMIRWIIVVRSHFVRPCSRNERMGWWTHAPRSSCRLTGCFDRPRHLLGLLRVDMAQ